MPIMRTQNWLQDLYNDLFENDYVLPQYKRASTPAINVIEHDKEFEVEIAAPGMAKEDFNINLNSDNELVISLEKKDEKEDKEKKHGHYLRREFSYTSFRQSFSLPETIDTDKIEAKMEHGVLKLRLPKKEETKEVPANKRIEIK